MVVYWGGVVGCGGWYCDWLLYNIVGRVVCGIIIVGLVVGVVIVWDVGGVVIGWDVGGVVCVRMFLWSFLNCC